MTSSQPAGGIQKSATTQPSNDDESVVSQALKELYVVPRTSAAVIPDTQPAQSIKSALRTTARVGGSSGLPNFAQAIRPDLKGNQTAGTQPASDIMMDSPYYGGGPYRSTGRHLTTHQREWTDYRYYGGQPSRYGRGMYRQYSGAGYGGWGYGYDEGDSFRFGFLKGYDRGYFDHTTNERVDSVLAHAGGSRSQGSQLFSQGNYQAAVDAFKLASEQDQGDPASRLCAGHSLFAVGRYREAVKFIRRAFELQPRIAHLSYDIRGDYGRPADFEAHLAALRKALDLAPNDTDRLFMLGYVLYYSNQRSASYPYFVKAVDLDRKDKLSATLMRNAQPSDVDMDAMKKSAPTQQPKK